MSTHIRLLCGQAEERTGSMFQHRVDGSPGDGPQMLDSALGPRSSAPARQEDPFSYPKPMCRWM